VLRKMWCPYCGKNGDVICWIIIVPMLCLGFYSVVHFVPIILGWR